MSISKILFNKNAYIKRDYPERVEIPADTQFITSAGWKSTGKADSMVTYKAAKDVIVWPFATITYFSGFNDGKDITAYFVWADTDNYIGNGKVDITPIGPDYAQVKNNNCFAIARSSDVIPIIETGGGRSLLIACLAWLDRAFTQKGVRAWLM